MSKWKLDRAHSEVGFKVRHLMITNVTGRFGEFTLEIPCNDDTPLQPGTLFKAKTNSVNTGNIERDTHLKSIDFFNSDKFEYLTYTVSDVQKIDIDNYQLEGELTIGDITKNVKFEVKFGGIQKDPWGKTKVGFSVEGIINRKDFGLTWNAALETGGVIVQDEVKLRAEIQLIKN